MRAPRYCCNDRPWVVVCSPTSRANLTLWRDGDRVRLQVGDEASSRTMDLRIDQLAWLRDALIDADLGYSDIAR